jgi:phage terminase large subunit-like protein
LAERLAERKQRRARRKLFTYYPDTGPLRRELYPKHLRFFALGQDHGERLFMAANRVGKSEGVGGYETVLHLTGRYPDWWQGRRFAHPISAWAAGRTNETTRDIVQAKLFGTVEGSGPTKRLSGTGLVPGEDIGDTSWKTGLSDLLDTVRIKHASGGWSTLGLKAYQQGRLDEEPPMDVYTECLIRTMTTNGLVLVTFTPLLGMSEVVLSFLPGGRVPDAP